MTDYILIGILALIVIGAALSVVKRARSKASCCSGSDYVAKSRKLKTVAAKKTFRVEGMHCRHCVNRVMENVQDIPHISAAVNLKRGTVTVSMEYSVDDTLIVAAIEKGGYRVVGTE